MQSPGRVAFDAEGGITEVGEDGGVVAAGSGSWVDDGGG